MTSRTANALGDRALPRWTHPVAWWAWALCLATAASRTSNPLLLLLIVATLAGLCCLGSLDTPTRFESPRDATRND